MQSQFRIETAVHDRLFVIAPCCEKVRPLQRQGCHGRRSPHISGANGTAVDFAAKHQLYGNSACTLNFSHFLPVGRSVFQGYGLTETATTVCMGPLLQKVGTSGSAGQLLPGIRARLLKSDGTYGRPGEQGELVVHSPSNALGYTNNEQA